MIGRLTGTLFLGHRDQVVTNTATGDFIQLGSDEFTTNFESSFGAQWVNHMSENRRVFARAMIQSSVWMGGGTGNDPTGDFGLYGFSVGLGMNH